MLILIKNHKSLIYLLALTLIGGFFRFYKLDWAEGLFTHPDEYHIAGAVAQLSYPDQMHPHFFSYGTVTIYLIYFTKELLAFLSQILNSEFLIPNSFLIGRFYSALFSTLTIIIVYKICRLFMEKRFSYLAAFLTAITPGLIQQAHFATPESALTFFLFGSLFFIIKFLKQNKILFLVLASVFLGFAMGVKVSSVVFLFPLTAAIFFKSYSKKGSLLKNAAKTILKFIGLVFVSLIITIAMLALVAPYVFLDFPAFLGNLEYEGGLAIGKFPVFYTRQFINTIPMLFQIEKILPYALGPAVLILGILGFIDVMLNLFQHLIYWAKIPKPFGLAQDGQVRNDMKGKILSIIAMAFLAMFLSNAFLFAKWTRFIAPTFPFFAIFASFPLNRLYSKNKSLSKLFTTVLLISTILWTTAFFSIYLRPDVRITASNWIEKNFPENSAILIEGGNMVDIPLKGNSKRMGFDFYNLETDAQARSQISSGLEEADYFLIQSRRVFMNHQRLPSLFQKTSNFYEALFNGDMGFEQIKEFHSYPELGVGILKLEVADETAEETWSVFDHPVIRVFKKIIPFPKENYERFFGN